MVKKKILIAEDDHSILEVMGIILTDAGYSTLTVDDGNGLIKRIEAYQPDLLLLDIWMGGKDGGEIAKQLKSHDVLKSIPIIIISANNDTEKIAKKAGADDFLQKPFNVDDLLDIVKRYLS
jgi:CheY-like chemotaxis protein